MKKILLVDDSALIRMVTRDIISSRKDYQVEDVAKDGKEAYELLTRKQYDAVILDLNMPQMGGLELLEKLRKMKIRAKVIVSSTLAVNGAKETLQALELGALDFVTKPDSLLGARGEEFSEALLRTLDGIVDLPVTSESVPDSVERPQSFVQTEQQKNLSKSESGRVNFHRMGGKSKIVAMACSTGGPKSLQQVIPKLPKDLDSAVLLVQHMPAGFTATLAERLNDLSEVTVREAKEGELIVRGSVYIAPGGKHLVCQRDGLLHRIHLTDDPPRDALKPCANTMYESLADSGYEEIVCVVLTGMGSDGSEGIVKLSQKKKTYVVAQNEQTCVVYGMPKAVMRTGLADESVALEQIADSIMKYVGVN